MNATLNDSTTLTERAISDEPVAMAAALMAAILRDGRPLTAEYPLIFEPRFGGRVLAQSVGESVVAACGVLPRSLVTPAASVPVTLIGSVATAKSHRGRGHGTALLARAEREAQTAGSVCTMLWADDAGWYSDRGFIPVGTEYIFVLNRGAEYSMPEPEDVREATPSDHGAMHALYLTQPRRVARNAEETDALLEGPGIRALVTEVDGAVTAYAVLGRGEDLGNVVHEWAGPIESVLQLLRAHLESVLGTEEAMYVMVPPGSRELGAFFTMTRTMGAQGVLCMAKLASIEAAAGLLDGVTPAEVSVEVIDAGREQLSVTGPKGSIVLTGHEVLLTLFPPRSDRKVIEVVEGAVGVALPELPLEPFVWGLDSI